MKTWTKTIGRPKRESKNYQTTRRRLGTTRATTPSRQQKRGTTPFCSNCGLQPLTAPSPHLIGPMDDEHHYTETSEEFFIELCLTTPGKCIWENQPQNTKISFSKQVLPNIIFATSMFDFPASKGNCFWTAKTVIVYWNMPTFRWTELPDKRSWGMRWWSSKSKIPGCVIGNDPCEEWNLQPWTLHRGHPL